MLSTNMMPLNIADFLSKNNYLIGGSEQLQSSDDLFEVSQLVIYPNNCLVTSEMKSMNTTSKKCDNYNMVLLSGYDENSVVCLNDNNVQTHEIIKDDQYLNGRHASVVYLDGDNVDGTIVDTKDIFPEGVTICDKNNNFINIPKWKSITVKNLHTNDIFVKTCNRCRVEYMIDSLYWLPLYNVHLDSDQIHKASGYLDMCASITNKTGKKIVSESISLVYGETVLNSSDYLQTRQIMYKERNSLTNNINSSNTVSVGELQYYPTKHKRITGQKLNISMEKFKIERVKTVYKIDVVDTDDVQYARYQYNIFVPDVSLPAGLLKMYCYSNKIRSTVLLASLNIAKKSVNDSIKLKLGATTKMSAVIKNQLIDKKVVSDELDKHIIEYFSVACKIFNDTEYQQKLVLTIYLGNSILLQINDNRENSSRKLIYVIDVKPGNHKVNFSYTTKKFI